MEATCRIQTSVVVVLLTLGLIIEHSLTLNAIAGVRRRDTTKACQTGKLEHGPALVLLAEKLIRRLRRTSTTTLPTAPIVIVRTTPSR